MRVAPRLTSLETPIGRLWLSTTATGLRAISRGDLPREDGILDEGGAAEPIRQLADYFRGARRGFSLALDLAGAPAFDVAAWRAAMEIPYGETVSYGELAAMAGHPRAARAAGGAMARCRLFPVVPCHRVIHADGSIRGWGGELWIKRWLLDLEAGRR